MDWKGRPLGAVAVAVLLMGVAAAENTVAPWAPFYVAYAALATSAPFWLRAVDLDAFRRLRVRYALAGLGLAVVLQGVFRLMTAHADLEGMFAPVLTVAAARLATPVETVARWYVTFIKVWAGFGEEIFYRGYLQRSLRSRLGPLPSIVGAALLFATRHYTQVLLAWPHIAWGSATIWVAATFVVGLVFGWLYEKSASLWPSILCHTLFNLLG
jgi:membrane protease YdiL (CAAX protease family)